MRRTSLVLAGLLLPLLIVCATPLGPRLLGALLESLAPGYGWRLEFGRPGGSFLGEVVLHRVKAVNPASGVEIEVERLHWSPWSHSVELFGPRVGLLPASASDAAGAAAGEAASPVLPLGYLPELRVHLGRLEWENPGGGRLQVEDLEAHYESVGDTAGVLTLAQAWYRVEENGRPRIQVLLKGRLALGLQVVEVEELHATLESEWVDADMRGHGRLGLSGGMPVDFSLDAALRADTLSARLEARLRGRLEPRELRIQVAGDGVHPDLGPLHLAAAAEMDSGQVRLDSLRLDFLEADLGGRASYHVAADSLEALLHLRGLELPRLPRLSLSGQVEGSLRSALNLETGRYTADLKLLGRAVDPAGAPVPFEVIGAYRPDRSTRIDLRSGLGRLAAAGWSDPGGGYDLELEGAVETAGFLGGAAEPVLVSGRARPDSLELELDLARLPFEALPAGPLRLQLLLHRQRFLEAALVFEEDQARLNLSADLAKGEIEGFDGALMPFELSRFEPRLEGRVLGQVDAAGGLDPASVELAARFDLEEVGYAGWRAGPLKLYLDYRDRLLGARLESPAFHARATLDGGRFEGSLEGDGILLERRTGAPADADSSGSVVLGGRLLWSGQLGHGDSLQVRADLDRLRLERGTWWVSSAGSLQVRYAGERAEIGRLQLATPLGDLRISGAGGRDSLQLEAEVTSLTLESLVPGLEGEGGGRLSLGGSLPDPQGRGRMEFNGATLSGRPLGDLDLEVQLADSLELEAELDQGGEAGPELRARFALPAADLWSAAADTGSRMHLALAARNLDLGALLTHALADSAAGLLAMDGDVSAPAALLTDPLQWRDLGGRVSFDRLEVGKENLRATLPDTGTVTLEGDHVILRDLGLALEVYDRGREGFRAGGRLGLQGRLQPAGSSLVTMGLEDLDLSVLEALEVASLPRGRADLRGRLAGSLRDPEMELDWAIAFEDLGEVEGSLEAGAQGGSADLVWITTIGDSLGVAITLPWDLKAGTAAWERGTLQAHSAGLDLLAFLDLFADLDHLGGRLSLDLEAGNFTDAVEVRGRMDIAGLSLTVLDSRPRYVFEPGSLVFDGRRAVLQGLTGSSRRGKGRIALSGYAELGSLSDLVYEVDLKAEDLPYSYDDIFEAPAVELDLSLDSTPTGSLLSGRVRMDGARVEPALIDLGAPPVPPPPPAVRDDFFERMELDVEVDVRAMEVENELMDLAVEGKAAAYGSFFKPRFQGEMRVVEGKVFLLNRAFDFRKGRLNLDKLVPTYSILDLAYDPFLLNPEVDIEAVTRVIPVDADDEEYEILFQLRGPALEVEPKFVAEGLTDNQTLMLLAFGYSSAKTLTDDNYKGAKDALYTTAGQLLVSPQIKKIGLDVFEILPSGTALETVGKISVSMGRYFKSPLPLWVRYEAATSYPSQGQFSVEHRLRSYLTITGTANSEYELYGLGVGLKKKF